MGTATRQGRGVVVQYEARGAVRDLFHCRAPEVVVSGPAGTGKTYGCLQKVHLAACKYPGMRGLVARQTLVSLTSTVLETYRREVLHPLDGVTFFGGNKERPAAYRYPNGSELVIGGLDKTTKIMSGQYDLIYVAEATEATEAAWEDLTSRLRNGVMPYQQIIGDCNPGPPSHWIKQRADRGAMTLLESRHEDNPRVWQGGDWTEYGRSYIARLDALTGVRKLRLRSGVWAAAEGLVYEGWDPRLHVVDPFPIPRDWPRYWGVDFGYTHAFSWGAWAQDPDGRLYLYREIYRTQRLVEDHARDIMTVTAGDPRPRALICDHDAEDRATLERHLKMVTTPAYKAVSPGIQAVAARLKVAGDGRPRLMLLRDALVEVDPALRDAHLPYCAQQEPEGYVWDTRAGLKRGEQPVKESDHFLDQARYVVAHVDHIEHGPPRPWRSAAAGERPAVTQYRPR